MNLWFFSITWVVSRNRICSLKFLFISQISSSRIFIPRLGILDVSCFSVFLKVWHCVILILFTSSLTFSSYCHHPCFCSSYHCEASRARSGKIEQNWEGICKCFQSLTWGTGISECWGHTDPGVDLLKGPP